MNPETGKGMFTVKLKELIPYFLFVLTFGIPVRMCAQVKSIDAPARPKLVVGIVVDQMRWDYLYRYQNRYRLGFKRLLSEGYSCDNVFITHLPSATAVGHTTIYTGSVPAIHGITGNNWIDQRTGKNWYCTEDTLVHTVGSTTNAGEMSPANMLVSTITDELRLATNFRSKVVGVSLKDRAAILPAGHLANAAFWMDDKTAAFITSSYYMPQLPDWVKQFNKKNEPENLVARGWSLMYPIDSYSQSSPDDVPWEGEFVTEERPVFPHDIKKYYQADHSIIRSTPYGNTLTLDFAKAAITGYHLGGSDCTDFLTINCASTDYVGHMYGPNSIEIEDTYLRLDKDLGEFFDFLDKHIGKGNYLLFLTADHGAAHSINYLKNKNIPSGQLDGKLIISGLNDYLHKKFNIEKLAISLLNYHVNFDITRITNSNLDYEKIKLASIAYLSQLDGILYAIDVDQINDYPIPQPIKEMVINGYYSKRCGPILIIPDAGWFDGSLKGTNHGNWNPYDTHIPLIFSGWHINHGVSNTTHSMTDITPTMASLLHIQMPSGCIGKSIGEVLQNK